MFSRPLLDPGAETEEPRRAPEGVRTGFPTIGERRAPGMSLALDAWLLGAALAERRGLADALAQEVQLGAAGNAVAHHFDLLDARAIDLEGALDADAAGEAANSDRPLNAARAKAHDRACEDLDAFACSFDDTSRDLDRVARGELGNVGPDLFLADLFEQVHDRSLLFLRRRDGATVAMWPAARPR